MSRTRHPAHAEKLTEYSKLQTTWDEPEQATGLEAVMVAAHDGETKLTEITAQVKEIFADAEEPEDVPSGDN